MAPSTSAASSRLGSSALSAAEKITTPVPAEAQAITQTSTGLTRCGSASQLRARPSSPAARSRLLIRPVGASTPRKKIPRIAGEATAG